jgi:hypothetical protein
MDGDSGAALIGNSFDVIGRWSEAGDSQTDTHKSDD